MVKLEAPHFSTAAPQGATRRTFQPPFTDTGGGDIANNDAIVVADDIGSLTVSGSIIGNVAGSKAVPVFIIARGQHTPGTTTDLAIGKIAIGGRVEWANILAGVNQANGDAQIGAVTVRGDWAASNLVAGADNSASSNEDFGNTGDASAGVGNPNIISKIASITIGGQVVGSPSSVSASDHFGFVAQQIGAFKAAGFTAILHTGPPADVIELSPVTGDVTMCKSNILDGGEESHDSSTHGDTHFESRSLLAPWKYLTAPADRWSRHSAHCGADSRSVDPCLKTKGVEEKNMPTCCGKERRGRRRAMAGLRRSTDRGKIMQRAR